MANIPYPLTGESMVELRSQVYELVRQIFEEKLGGADLGDVFSMPGDVLTLVLYDNSLIKVDNKLAVQLSSIIGGLQVGSDGLSIKLVATGGLSVSIAGLTVKLDGGSLKLSSAGLKILSDVTTLVAGTVTVNNTTVTANSMIFLIAQDNNSTGALRVSARTVGVSFTITSSVSADSGVVAWMMLEP